MSEPKLRSPIVLRDKVEIMATPNEEAQKAARPVSRHNGLAWTCCVVPFLLFAVSGNAQEPAPKPASSDPPIKPPSTSPADTRHYEEEVRPFLARHCVECHGAVKPKGDLRLDGLAPDFDNPANRERWLSVLKRVKTGEMPPKAKPRPPEKEVQALGNWISAQAAAAREQRAAEGRVVLRRLNRIEYENTIRDLLGVEIDLKEQLPQDGSADGFDNVGSALHISSFLMEKYLEAADKALTRAIPNRPQPKSVKKRYSLKNQHQVKVSDERVFRLINDTVVCFSSSAWQEVRLYEFYPSERGQYRFRISASGFQSAGKPVTFRVGAGAGLGTLSGKSGLVGYFDAPADKPTVVEFVESIEARQTIAILPYGLAGSNVVHKIGADKYEGPGLAVQWVEVEGPLNDTWPPVGHRAIFGDLAQGPVPTRDQPDRVEVISKNARGGRRTHPSPLRPPRVSASGDRRRHQAVPRSRQGATGREALV